jgi:hypothetical protein
LVICARFIRYASGSDNQLNTNIFTLAKKITYLLLIGLILLSTHSFSQGNPLQSGASRLQGLGNRFSGAGGGDSLKRRDNNEDSITVRFRYLDSTRNYTLDSTIGDFTRRFPIPATNIFLGNTGTASRSILFSPTLKPGWDPGFHSYDIYKWALDKVKFYNTTRPYSELNYMIASRSEQMIEILHTQNIKPNWNFLMQYRLINSPGFFKNQKTNHNNYTVSSWYQTINKRYNAYLVLLGNKLQASENGGIEDLQTALDDPDYKDRFNIATRLGGDPESSRNFFSTDVGTGTRYNEFTVLFRQQYDLGRKDSLVTDSTVVPLFYPRLRFEHTFTYGQYKYQFRDFIGDSNYYKTNYGVTFDTPIDTFSREDRWKEFVNDFSIYQFPDANNLQQFFKVGAALQNIVKENPTGNVGMYNVFGHAEYRNRTRNQKWDIEANGKLYLTGLNAGDFLVQASLQRFISRQVGYAQIGFENANRTPSFTFDSRSNFYLLPTPVDFKKENTTHLYASLFKPDARLKLSGHYYLLTNYTYITDYYQLQQHGSLFNFLQIGLQKTIRLGKRWNWHADIYFQQAVGDAPVNVPVIFTRNRIAYEGSLGFKNLNIAIGLESRYHTPYKADGYSPILGQFYYQDSITISNTPDLSAYMNFRIRSFKLFARFDNLNTASLQDGFGFTNNNVPAPGYAYPGMVFRLGIFWGFVN